MLKHKIQQFSHPLLNWYFYATHQFVCDKSRPKLNFWRSSNISNFLEIKIQHTVFWFSKNDANSERFLNFAYDLQFMFYLILHMKIFSASTLTFVKIIRGGIYFSRFTLISLINVESFIDFEKKIHPPRLLIS